MKLYATVSSERATKGQGGKNLEVKFMDEKRNMFLSVVVTNDEKDNIVSEVIDWSKPEGSSHLFTTKQTIKSKKQKGEKCYCSDDDMSLPHYH